MEEPNIDHIISSIAGKCPMIDRVNYEGFEMDVDAYLEQSGAFENIITKRTKNPLSVMEIRADLTKSVRTFRKLDKAIRGAWRMIKYGGFEASSIQHDKNFTIFRFVTAPIDRIYYVSGTLHVGGNRYLKVFENMKTQGYT